MIFLDTSFIIAYYNDIDENHDRAMEISRVLEEEAYGDVFMSDYIFNECASVLFMRLKSISKSVNILEDIKKSVNLVFMNEFIFDNTLEIFRKQRNTKFSFTDCSILSIMEHAGVKNLVSFDRDFNKIEGINVVC